MPAGRTRDNAADLWVHVSGMVLGTGGAIVLVARVVAGHEDGPVVPILIYAFGLVAMLYCSAAYNLAVDPARRALLRRLDHAAIFVMIAGTYTPFLARSPADASAVALMAFIWTVAFAGIIAKLVVARSFEALSVTIYLALGWTLVAGFGPLTATLDSTTVYLLIAGGVLYSVGVASYLWHSLPFHRAIWHLFVLVAAGCHYAAVLRIAA